MPVTSSAGQPERRSGGWFDSDAGAAVLSSEADAVMAALAEKAGLPWLWLAPDGADHVERAAEGSGLQLFASERGWRGDVRASVALPLATESVGVVIVQHVLGRGPAALQLLEECARVLVPGGRMALFALNPLAPYRWRWRGAGLTAAEPLAWRRRLRHAGLAPEPLSQGLGPTWRAAPDPIPQQGVGLRAAYLLRAEKRSLPLTPVRARRRTPLAAEVPAR